MEIVSNIALISINETLFVQLISFLVFLFVINRVMFRPLQGIMDERSRHIEQLQLDIVDADKTVQAMTEQIKAQEADARAEAAVLMEELEEAGKAQAVEIDGVAKGEIAQLKAQAEKEVELQVAEARKKLVAESEALSVTMMEKILDRRLVS